ncbi:MAG TPA: hypothetical protein VMX56_05755 [Anaerolineales bacterium]|nr:hypothetical protein [Anaerolineales bacterium]
METDEPAMGDCFAQFQAGDALRRLVARAAGSASLNNDLMDCLAILFEHDLQVGSPKVACEFLRNWMCGFMYGNNS